MGHKTFIAEVKTKSPYGFVSPHSWDYLFSEANVIGDWISIHTDTRWAGSMDLIKKARSLTDKPILAKGFHETDEQIEEAILAGADYVLVVGRIPAVHQDKCLIEPYSFVEPDGLQHGLYKVVWNDRDLKTGEKKDINFNLARQYYKGWLCQASNIVSREDIHPEADAILVGTNLLNFV